MNLKKLLLFISPIIIFLLVWVMVKVEPVNFMDADDLEVLAFTDKGIDKGRSEIVRLDTSQAAKGIVFRLNEGFISPYAGMTLHNKRYWDLRAFDEVMLHLELENTKNLEMTITTFQNGVTKDHDALSYRHNVMEIPIVDHSGSYKLPLEKLSVAQWWLERFKLRSTELGTADMGKVKSLSFVAKIRLDESKDQALHIKGVTFSKDLSSFYLTSGILLCLWYLGVYISSRLRNISRPEAPELVIHYKQSDTGVPEEDNTENIFQFIAASYQDPDLTLQQMSTRLHLPERNISGAIKNRFNLTFKEYLNGIRIAEAKRLLKESDKNVSEIAYQVGFNSPNHFNRTFKSLENCTPTEYKSRATTVC